MSEPMYPADQAALLRAIAEVVRNVVREELARDREPRLHGSLITDTPCSLCGAGVGEACKGSNGVLGGERA